MKDCIMLFSNFYTLMSMMSIGLVFILIITGAWKRSISTTIYIISLVFSLNCFEYCSYDISVMIIMSGAIIALIRAVINTEKDKVIKRDH